jgi:hypothetical protein
VKRYRQTLEELIAALSEVETTWMDDHSAAVVDVISSMPEKERYQRDDVAALLDADYDAALTTIRLALEMPKDEFVITLKNTLKGKGGTGIARYKKERDAYLSALETMGIVEALTGLVSRPVDWRDILTERLKCGRGSAIKGQKRGRALEDFAEEIVKAVFSDVGYDTRCRFIGAKGTSTEKTDFAIPSREDPRILIECKAYGATGSKQTDILGDLERVVAQKRPDTHSLLVVDGVSWTRRESDLRRLVEWQNHGRIARIYTQQMASELEADLRQLRKDHSLG